MTTMHPIGGREVGWEAVSQSFAQVGGIASEGSVTLSEQRLQIVGDLAYEAGVERGQAVLAGEKVAIGQRVTNVYKREPGGWKIVHHHADASPAMVELLTRLQSAAS